MANFFESITIFSLDYNRKINTSNKNNIVPRDRRTGPVGFKSWIDTHRGRLQLIRNRLDNPKTRRNVSKVDRFCIDDRIKEIDYVTNMYYYYFYSIIVRTIAKKSNEYYYDYEYDHNDLQLMDTWMIKFERRLHGRIETLQQILSRVDKYLNNKKRNRSEVGNKIVISSRNIDATAYKFSVDSRLREIDYFNDMYDIYFHPESCEHSNPAADYSTVGGRE
jgi:hypothetical protein